MNRDRILEQALKHERRTGDAVTPECVDAELLAAWQDDALDAAQMSRVELHLSNCARCQAMLAAFARGTEITPSTQDAANTLRTHGTAWWRWWLAPLAAGATAAVLWMVVPDQQQIATAPPERPAATETAQPQVPAEPLAGVTPTAPPAPKATQDVIERKLRAEARADRQQLADAAPSAAKEEGAIAQAQPAPPPAAPIAAAAPAPAPAPSVELQKSARLAFAPLVFASPDGTRRWRIVNNIIERSDDDGATWTQVRNANETLTAGACASATTCWVAGTAGVVLRTVDALSFARVDLPEPLNATAVQAIDGNIAIVTTADGRRFRTDDAGRTWRQIQA